MARLKGFERLTNVDEALSMFLKALKPKRLGAERVSVEEALGRVAAEDILAPDDLPSVDRSAVDGYAVRSEDTSEASQFKPKKLRLIHRGAVGRGQAMRIWTGNPLPRGATAVIMLEQTRQLKGGSIEVITAVTPGENVSRKAEDIKKGEVAVQSGARLQPHHIGFVVALGITNINVVRKPRIALLSTGNELVEFGRKPRTDQVVNSNRFVIAGLCQESGAEPLYLGIAKDNEDEIGKLIIDGLEKADVVITTGGTSVGEADLVPIVVSKLSKPGIIVHGVAMRPGMPTALGILKGKPIFILSGNPVAAIIGFEVFARPTIQKLLGVEDEPRPMARAKLTKRVAGALGRRVYLRVKAFEKAGELFAEPIRTRGSALYSTMTKANGFVIIPEDLEGLDESETVTVHLFSSLAK